MAESNNIIKKFKNITMSTNLIIKNNTRKSIDNIIIKIIDEIDKTNKIG